ncbi:hypothetical protein VTI74DRAFT_5595 [Chaetomium olivicolor]
MSILAWGNEIILTSSQKGSQSFSYNGPDTPLQRSLQLCQAVVWQDVTGAVGVHKNQGKCGEEMAVHLYYKLNLEKPLKDLSPQAVVGTWVADDIAHLSEPIRTDPCGIPEKPAPKDIWGCNLFVFDQNLRVLDKSIKEEPYDFAAVGGVQTINQIQLCG